MSQESDEATSFERRAREVLEESTAKLDGRTLSRLTQARHAAFAHRGKPAVRWWRGWVPTGAATAAAVLAVMFWAGPRPGRDANNPLATANGNGSAFEDIDLLADAPDFVGDSDDVEFYEWAAGEIES